MTKKEAREFVRNSLIGHLNASLPDEIHATDDSESEAKISEAMEDAKVVLLNWSLRKPILK